ncbi:MAG: hypothetical protein RMK74_09780, partial [Myxococcales bacterium]|nr:hypothetical protein [Myxococcales bacterium]
MDEALRAAFGHAVQRAAASEAWNLSPAGAGRWVAREDGAGFVLDARGVELVPSGRPEERDAPRARLRTVRVGRGGAFRALAPQTPRVRDNRAVYVHGEGLEETWLHGPLGMEQLFRLGERPAGEGWLEVHVRVEGALRPRVVDDEVQFVDGRGHVRAWYAEPFAYDARGRRLPLRWDVDGNVLRLRVDDASAVYPVIVDPLVWVQQARLTAGDGSPDDAFGWSVALSNDATMALIGAYRDDSSRGSAYAFFRTGTTWVQQARLTASDGTANDLFGHSVALSSDGNLALVGAYGDDGFRGAAYVFTHVTGVWTQRAKLVAISGASDHSFGYAVALSPDGRTALVGAPYYDDAATDRGAAYVFYRGPTPEMWTEVARLLASDGGERHHFGISVALSGDGSTALIGALGESSFRGAAYVYTDPMRGWSQQAKLTAADGMAGDRFGNAVALSGDGRTALVGAHFDDGAYVDQGSGYVFAFSVATGNWTQQAQLVATSPAANARLGYAVALGGSMGDVALLGAFGDDASAGAVLVYTRIAGSWTPGPRLVASDRAAGDEFGAAVAMSADGTRALVGARGDDSRRGSAYVFRAGLPNGEACSDATQCESGHCVDGVCCESACGGGVASDCQACSTSAGGADNGRCTSLRADVAPTVTCRPAAGTCDVAETCSASSTVCPPDGVHPAGTVCRVPVGPCDVAETCDGSSPHCPSNRVAPAGTVCRAPVAECDSAETCDGFSVLCPPDATSCASMGSDRPLGTPCDRAGQCASGHCIDGVCCDGPCGGGATNDCRACSIEAGAAVSGR